MHPSCILVNTQIINIQGFYICDRLAFKILFENTKSISFYFSVMFCNKNRLLLINNYSLKLLICLFLLTDCKKVGADIAVNLVNLKKELVKLRYIFKFCPSYCYFTHNFIFQSYKKYLVQFRFAETFNIYFTTLKN